MKIFIHQKKTGSNKMKRKKEKKRKKNVTKLN